MGSLRLAAFLLAMSISTLYPSQAKCDQFLTVFVPVSSFQDFEYSPFRPTKGSYSSFAAIPIQCTEMRDLSKRYEVISKQFQSQARLETRAFQNNNTSGFDFMQKIEVQYYLRLIATRGRLSVIGSMPTHGFQVLHPAGPLQRFLLAASLAREKIDSWLESLKLLVIHSPIPIETWKSYSGTYSDHTVAFKKSAMPDVKSWDSSVGRMATAPPLQLRFGRGRAVTFVLPYERNVTREPFTHRAPTSKDVSLGLGLTQGEFCHGIARNGTLFSFRVAYRSVEFGGETVNASFLVGFRKRAAAGPSPAGTEGNYRALDHLLRSFLMDVLGKAQRYRISDSELKPFDPGTLYSPVLQLYGADDWAPKNPDWEALDALLLRIAPKTSLRTALAQLDDKLERDGDAPSYGDLINEFSRLDRYKGVTVRSYAGDGTREAVDSVEFRYKAKNDVVKIAFYVASDKYLTIVHDRYKNGVKVAYVKINGKVLFKTPILYCGTADGSRWDRDLSASIDRFCNAQYGPSS